MPCDSLVLVGSTFSFFFFKQKTAYVMRFIDWISDVCSSDLWRVVDFDVESCRYRSSLRRSRGEGGRSRSEWWRDSDVSAIAPPSALRAAPSVSLRDREDLGPLPFATNRQTVPQPDRIAVMRSF